MPPRNALLRRLPRILSTALVALATAELAARVDDWLTEGVPLTENQYSIDRIFQFSPDGVTGRPGARYLKWRLNSQGFRGPEIDPTRPRIATWGASETFGLYESPDQEYPRQLERLLAARCPGPDSWQVVNLALPGSSLSGGLKAFDQALAAVRPALILIYPSLANSALNPLMREQAEARRPRSAAAPAASPPATPAGPPWPKFESRLAGRLSEIAKNAAPEWLLTAVRQVFIWRATRQGPVYDRIPDAALTRFRAELAEVVDRAERAGVRPVLVTHANRFGHQIRPEDRPQLIAWRRFYPLLREEGFLDMEKRLNDVIRHLAADRGLILIDAARMIPPGGRSFVEFVHFTDEGARQMAQALADGLAAQGLACPPPAARP